MVDGTVNREPVAVADEPGGAVGLDEGQHVLDARLLLLAVEPPTGLDPGIKANPDSPADILVRPGKNPDLLGQSARGVDEPELTGTAPHLGVRSGRDGLGRPFTGGGLEPFDQGDAVFGVQADNVVDECPDRGSEEPGLGVQEVVGECLRGLERADLLEADLTGADLTDANLTGANLTDAGLTAVTWSNTICPDGTNSDADGDTCSNNLG